jgi:hypothetical protein
MNEALLSGCLHPMFQTATYRIQTGDLCRAKEGTHAPEKFLHLPGKKFTVTAAGASALTKR